MDTIFIENLSYTGIHGVYEEEHYTPQRFTIDLKMHVETAQAGSSDNLNHTVDYKVIQEEIQKIIEGKHHNLIESLAEEIANEVLTNTLVTECEITLRKPDAFPVGLPGITIRRKNRSSFLNEIDTITLTQTLDELKTKGIAKLPLLQDTALQDVINEALHYPLTQAESGIGTYKVKQNFKYFRNFPKSSPLWKLAKELEQLLGQHNVFSTPLRFNEITAQLYQPSKEGISAHKDESRFKNIIVIFVLQGKGDFYTADDRNGNNKRLLETSPGDVIFMCAPGFYNSNERPIHGLENITKERLSLTFRQEQ